MNDQGGLYASLSEDAKTFGVVEAPCGKGNNRAYILDGQNQTVWNVTELFTTAHRLLLVGAYAHFTDVRSDLGIFTFYVDIRNCDYRFVFDLQTGEPGTRIESR